MKTEVETKRNPEKKVLNVKDCDGDQDGDEYGGAVGDEGGKFEFNTKISSPLPTFGPLDCPDVTLVFHINVSLLYMLFSDHCLNSTCYDIPYTLHK